MKKRAWACAFGCFLCQNCDLVASDILKIFEDNNAVISGHFELRSGLHSDRYFQCARILRYPKITEELCKYSVENLHKKLGQNIKVDYVLSPALGGIPIGHEVARALDTQSIFAEKVNGKLELRRFGVERNKSFVVVDDVVTEGGSIRRLIDIVKESDGKVLAALIFVDRSVEGELDIYCPIISLLRIKPELWKPEECPLCKSGVKMVHPGS